MRSVFGWKIHFWATRVLSLLLCSKIFRLKPDRGKLESRPLVKPRSGIGIASWHLIFNVRLIYLRSDWFRNNKVPYKMHSPHLRYKVTSIYKGWSAQLSFDNTIYCSWKYWILWTELLYLGREYPLGYSYFRDRLHQAFRSRAALKDEEEIKREIRKAEYVKKGVCYLNDRKFIASRSAWRSGTAQRSRFCKF